MSAPDRIDETLLALADPVRRGVIDLLRVRPRRAGELAADLGTSSPVMSKHLRVLRTRGLIEEVPEPADARARVYRLRPEHFEALEHWLQDVASFWSAQLAEFKTAAEAKRTPE
jgi:DNA-binding transcriptional ArsR family regulator